MQHSTRIGTLLRRYRLATGLTQEELAERAGLSVHSVSDLERGLQRKTYRETIRRLVEALQLTGEDQRAFESAARGIRDEPACSELVPAAAPRPPAVDAAPLPLVGRARELELLELHVMGRGARVFVLAGEPGIGKTRLLQHAAERARHEGSTVLMGGCQRRSLQEPYAPFPAAFAQCLAGLSSYELREALRECNWLVRVLPEFSSVLKEPAAPGRVSPEQERRLVFNAVGRLLANLGERTSTLVVLDDLQWTPADALDLLMALLHDPVALNVRVVCAYRSTEVRPQDPLAVVLADLAHAGFARQHTLGPLSELEARQLLESLIDDPQRNTSAAEPALRRAGGVPFYLVSYAQNLRLQAGVSLPAEDVPWDIAHSIRQRAAALSETAQEVLGVASVVGRVVPYALLRLVTGHREEDLLAALDAAHRARLLLEHGDRAYQFAHDVIREVVEADLGAARRITLHRAIGEGLEVQPGEPPAEELAYHYARSDHPERAVPHLVKAATQASAASAYQQEAALLAQAIELAPQAGEADLLAELHARRGKALFALTRWPEARAEMEMALKCLPVEHAERRAEILIDAALSSPWMSDAVTTRRYASEALAVAQTLGREDLAVSATSALILADGADGDLHGALKRYRQGAARSRDRYAAALAVGTEMVALIQYWQADFEEAIATAREAIQIGRTVQDTSTVARALGNLGCALTGAGRYDEALRVFTEVEEFCREQGAINWLARSTAIRGGLHLEVFDFDCAAALAEEARDLGRSANWPNALASGGIDLLLNFARRGEIARTEKLVDQVAKGVERGQGAHGWLWKLRFAQAQAEIALVRGNVEEALRSANSVIAQSRRLGRVKYEVSGLQARAQALAAQGRVPRAIADLESAVERARETGDPAMFIRVAAVLLDLDGNDALLAEARAMVDRVVNALPYAAMVARFRGAEPVRLIVSQNIG